MDMTVPFTAMVMLDEDGNLERISAMSNISYAIFELPLDSVPEYLMERIALLKMCDINKEKQGEAIGRKFNNTIIYVYLSYDEFKELTPLSRVTT
jgi:hypothetical protein